jgi:hypothetical protein
MATHKQLNWCEDEFPGTRPYTVTRDTRESETPVTGGYQVRKFGSRKANRRTRRMVKECIRTGVMPTCNHPLFTQWDIS